MALNIGIAELKGSWDNHALPDDSITVTPANRNSAPSSSSEPDHNKIMLEAKAGWTTKLTSEIGQDEKVALAAKERFARMQTSAASTAITQSFINRMETEIAFQIEAIRFDIQQNAAQTEQTFEAIEKTEDSLAITKDTKVEQTKQLMSEAQEAAQAEHVLETAQETHEIAAESMNNADAYGGLAEAQAAAQHLNQATVILDQSKETYAEEAADVDAARTRLEATQNHIDGFKTRLSELRIQADKLGEQAVELSEELEKYEAFQDYLGSDEVAELVASGKMSLEDLQANGMPEDVSRRIAGDTTEVTRGYDLSDTRDLWVDMRRGLSDAATSFFEKTGLGHLTNSFGMASANTPNAPDTPAVAALQTAELSMSTTPAGTTLG